MESTLSVAPPPPLHPHPSPAFTSPIESRMVQERGKGGGGGCAPMGVPPFDYEITLPQAQQASAVQLVQNFANHPALTCTLAKVLFSHSLSAMMGSCYDGVMLGRLLQKTSDWVDYVARRSQLKLDDTFCQANGAVPAQCASSMQTSIHQLVHLQSP